MRTAVLAMAILAAACGSSVGGKITATARMLNGATPAATGPLAPPRSALVAAGSDGAWQVSPDKLRLTLDSLYFQSQGQGQETVQLTGCQVTYDRSQPGLTKLADCPFSLATGTYTHVLAKFSDSYDVLINDATNGIFTDPTSPTKLSRSAPAGGAQFVTVTTTGGFPLGNGDFNPPWVATASTPDAGTANGLTVSVVIDALQYFQVTISGSTATIGVDGMGNVKAPDTVVAVGTPAAVNYYVASALGTALSFNLSALDAPAGFQGMLTLSVLYSSPTTPSALSMGFAGSPTGCGPFGAMFYLRGEFGYLGLDASGTLGWAGTSATDTTSGTPPFTSVMSLAQAGSLGASTVFKCLQTSVDPAPGGGSFDSGAPSISNPTFSETMQLIAK